MVSEVIHTRNLLYIIMKVMEFISLLIGLIGACAWIPSLVEVFENRKSTIFGVFRDVASISKFRLGTEDDQIVTGFLVILAIDFHAVQNPFYITRCDVKIKFADSDRYYESRLCNQVNFFNTGKGNEKIPMTFDFPEDSSILKRPFISAGEDNVKILPCFLECDSSRHPLKQQDLDKVVVTFRGSGRSKQKVVIDLKKTNVARKGFIADFAKRRESES